VAAYFVAVAALWRHGGWSHLGVPQPSPIFLDTRSVTSAWVCHLHGVPVLAANPCDPLGRPANYPQLWLLPAHAGLGTSATIPLGVAIAAAFFAAAFVVLRPRDAVDVVLIALALCAPAVMLGVDRGNVDLLLFAIVAAGVLISPTRPVGRGTLVLTAACLKLYPIFALGSIGTRGRRARTAALAVAVAFAVYAWLTWSDIKTIERVVPQQIVYSYGNDVFATYLAGRFPGGHDIYAALLLGATLSVAVITARRSRHLRPRIASTTRRGFERPGFFAGAGIYIGTFLASHNFDYRLVFLLLAVPQLLSWARAGIGAAAVAVTAGLVALWLIQGPLLVLGLVAQQVLFAALVALVLLAVPPRLERPHVAAASSTAPL